MAYIGVPFPPTRFLCPFFQTSDTLLAIAPCPRMEQRREELFTSEEATQMLKQHEKTVKFLSTQYNITNIGVSDVWKIEDDLRCLTAHNATLPKWYTLEVATELGNMTDYFFKLIFTDKRILKLSVGVYLKDTLDRMESLMINASTLEPILAYSAHDTNVASLLGAFGVYAGEHKPEYASIVMLELVGPPPPAQKSDFVLRLFYKRGWRDNSGEYLQFEACKFIRNASEGCPFDMVYRSVESLMLDSDHFEEACKVDWIPARYKVIVAVLLSTFLLLFLSSLGALYCIVWRRRRSCGANNMPYSPLVSPTTA
uniref:2-phosphoxylose phosphatase 1 n=1 Tax=Mesocestoides corti TaxID=53468 RepID=A0A5K3F1H3_MESCO